MTSIGLGEDGPTHQPVEHLAALRAIPNMRVFRPCDAIETAECWELALNRIDGPTVLALTRQNLPQLRNDRRRTTIPAATAPMNWSRRKATQKCRCSPPAPRSRSRSPPRSSSPSAASRRGWSRCPRWNCCWRSRRIAEGKIIGNAPVKIAIEAAVRWGWDAVIGQDGEFVGMHGFGASAPAKDLYKHFGITAEAAVNAALKRLG